MLEGHDSGHNGVTLNRSFDSIIGIFVGPLLTGVSISWWKSSHNMHHVSTNSAHFDPDIQHLPFLAVSERFFSSIYSYYHKRELTFNALARFLVSYQHIVFFPLMAFARFNLYVQSWLLLLTESYIQHRLVEIFALFGFYTWLGFLISFLPSNAVRIMFILVSHVVAGILHVQICISHFSMEIVDGANFSGAGDAFVRHQLATTLNLESNALNEWFFGGLQYQVEHHLFPRMPRHNLRRAREIVRTFCKEHDLQYNSMGWWEALGSVVRTLRETAHKAASGEVVDVKETALWHGLFARG
jgi:fatty acid desaturase